MYKESFFFFPVLISFCTIAASSTKRKSTPFFKNKSNFKLFYHFFSSIAIFSLGYIEPSITMVIPVLKK